MFYVYLLRSMARTEKTYVGLTEGVEGRLEQHNNGENPSTARFRPWELIAFVAVANRVRAAELERYFKTGSGHAFARRHLW